MLELLLLLPLIMVSILTMTFQVSVDELSHGHFFQYDEYGREKYRSVQDKVLEFYAKMVDELAGRPPKLMSTSRRKQDRKGIPGEVCNVQAIQTLQRRCLCQKPRKRCVRIEPPNSSIVSSMPECVIVQRCEGVCPTFQECIPLEVEYVTIPVIYLNLVVTESGSHLTPDCTTASVAKHLKCGCSCPVPENECPTGQAFDDSLCRCECRQADRAKECQRSGKYWDATNCRCVCPPSISQICSTGAFFHQELCRCVPVEKPGHGRRWKPPV